MLRGDSNLEGNDQCRLHFGFLPYQPCSPPALCSPVPPMRRLSAGHLRSSKLSRVLPKPCNGEAEVGDGALRLPEALSGGQSLAARWPPPTALAIMVLAITVHRPRLWRTVLLQATRSLTACSGSDLLIRAAGPISGTMEIVTPVPDG